MTPAPAGWRYVLVDGVALGLLLGVVARAWMRWISTDPEFTWAGTIGIMVAFTVFATAHATAHVVRSRSGSRAVRGMTRGLAGVLSLGIFGAAGSVMLPTVVLAAWAVWRPTWRWLRVVLLSLGAIAPVWVGRSIVVDFGWSLATIGRLLTFVAIYTAVIWLVGATVRPSPEPTAAIGNSLPAEPGAAPA